MTRHTLNVFQEMATTLDDSWSSVVADSDDRLSDPLGEQVGLSQGNLVSMAASSRSLNNAWHHIEHLDSLENPSYTARGPRIFGGVHNN